jgi:diguanylate cyclase (GGDEF)-like protein
MSLLADSLLTTDRRQRFRLAQTLLACGLVIFSLVALQFGAALGYVDRGSLWWWSATALGGMVAAFLIIRSGANRRMRDPAMTMPQMIYGMLGAAWLYSFTGAAHATAFMFLAIVLMFGIFGLSVRQTLALGAGALALFAVTMTVMTRRDPQHYPPRLELMYFMMLVVMVGCLAVLTSRLQKLRDRVHRQKTELEAAVAHIHRLATHDELTGLVNRRHMQELLETERLRSQRTRAPWCVVVLDLDHFKRINDIHGHAVGDDALRALGQHAHALVRKTDVLARWGGEEFVLLLPDTGVEAARCSVERLREHFHAAPLHVHGISLQLSFSAGLTAHRTGESVSQAIERADKLCYQAKDLGRNRVEQG